jgi:phospholipid transport system substrate-binding protein
MMKTLMKFFTFAVPAAVTFAFSGSALAQEAQEAPDKLISRISQEVLASAKTDKDVQSGNRQRIMQLVETKIVPHADFQRATALVTGRYWRTATPLQQQQLTDEFRKLLVYTYSGAMAQVRDQQIDVKPLRADPASIDDVIVNSEFRKSRGAEPVQVSYRLAKAADGWKIYDVNVMGMWVGLTYKDSFANELNKGGIDGLITTLSEKNRKLGAGVEAKPSRSAGAS